MLAILQTVAGPTSLQLLSWSGVIAVEQYVETCRSSSSGGGGGGCAGPGTNTAADSSFTTIIGKKNQ